MKAAVIWIAVGILLTVSVQSALRFLKSDVPILQKAADKEATIVLDPPLKAGSSPDLFTFYKAALFRFESANEPDKNLENCLVMREWNTNKAYYSCGKKGQHVFYLEGKYYNNLPYPVNVHAGNFRIPLGPGKYLNQNFTTEEAVEVESGVEYLFRIVFEDFDQVPRIFEIEYGENDFYEHSLKVDLINNTVTPLK